MKKAIRIIFLISSIFILAGFSIFKPTENGTEARLHKITPIGSSIEQVLNICQKKYDCGSAEQEIERISPQYLAGSKGLNVGELSSVEYHLRSRFDVKAFGTDYRFGIHERISFHRRNLLTWDHFVAIWLFDKNKKLVDIKVYQTVSDRSSAY
ncbi:hypothetical protein [Acinetobacter pullicarnis]|uniref:hypothetical protein n=1 Tax=Acinetobacter pullicarnis TaxID=2576829 RepID=UPI00111EF953|nr:hypothetical protein [Acinetobacter pullicarnis]